MKKFWIPIVLFLVFCLPSLVYGCFKSEEVLGTDHGRISSDTACSIPDILVKNGETIRKMELDVYVKGVLLGEMPADFELDALKAQAVAIRTYTLRKVVQGGKHNDANVCTDASCCQAFVSDDEYLSAYKSSTGLEKIQKAVVDTKGQVLTYQGKLIEATYFSCSGGMTEDAVAVWGSDVPYLRAVVSPGEDKAPSHSREITFSKEEFLGRLGLTDSTGLNEAGIAAIYTSGGGIDKLTIGGKTFSGVQVRGLLGLPSTAFSIHIDGDNVNITTKGYGHRVGLSQYGADAMALAGKDYKEILAHYYQDTKLEVYTDDQMCALFDKAGNL